MAGGESSADATTDTSEAVYIQESQKTRGVVGEKMWGPYKIHKGSDITSKYAGGPWGLGDPDDHTLRKVEQEILIPNMMKRNAKMGVCKAAYDLFFKCTEEHGMLRMTYKCRDRSKALRKCVTDLLESKDEIQKATQEYLDIRAEFRRTGKRLPLKRT